MEIKTIVKGTTANIHVVKDGFIHYYVEVEGNTYEFPVDMNDQADVGESGFPATIKAITLMRYIRKSLSNNEFKLVKN